MGNKVQDPHDKESGMSSIHKEYTPAFKTYKANPNALTTLMPEVPNFAQNLQALFPQAQKTFEAFFEMCMYLRREQKHFQINEHAKTFAPKTNLLDRFFIIVKKCSLETYESITLSVQELDQTFNDYFKIFVKDPEKGSIQKILKFMGKTQTKFKLCEFTQALRGKFPNVIRYLKDYYALKFKRQEKDGLLLKNFNSHIIKNDAILLSLRIPRLVEPEILCLYNTEDYGLSFHSMEKQLVGYTGPWLVLVQHSEKNAEGEKESYVFGSYQNGPIRDISTHQGDMFAFMFKLNPEMDFYTSDLGEGGTNYFYLNSISNERFGKRRGIGFGGDEDKKNFKLWIDQDLDLSTVYNGKDRTYGFGTLASPGLQKLRIRRLQFWGLGHKYNYQEQKEYWKERDIEIQRRRKVDKRDLVGQNAGLFFEKTFAHREQMRGQLQKPERKEEQK